MGSCDAHYKLLFDDSAFLFNQRKKSFVYHCSSSLAKTCCLNDKESLPDTLYSI